MSERSEGGVRTVYGILGWPVAHSRSPAMHEAGFRALGIDAAYVPFPVAPERLAEAVHGLRALGVAGANVTLPHKQAVMAHLDAVEPEAQAIGAVNTILREGDRLIGANTDAPGLVRALVEAGFEPSGARVVVVGAGGAARAAVVGLAQAGAASVAIAARRLDRAQLLADDLGEVAGRSSLEAVELTSSRQVLSSADLLVQATSATLDGGPDAEAFARALPLDALPAHAVVNDLVYRPRRTAVLTAASARGLGTVDGLGMLLHQGVIAFERWTGRSAPVDVMREALERR